MTSLEYMTAFENITAECRRNGRPNGTIHYLRDVVARDAVLHRDHPRFAAALLAEIDSTVDKLRSGAYR